MSTTNQLDQLRQYTRIVADTGDFGHLKEFSPEDATTNPTLIMKAAMKPEYKSVVAKALSDAKQAGFSHGDTLRLILVYFGLEILKIVPHRVSTETSAELSFDTPSLVQEAHFFIDTYAKHGIGRERILIKLASTWEGIQAAKVLQKEGINCNMTLLFCLAQAVAAAEAGARLISPFVGRILDWHKAANKRDYAPAEDPGVLSVKEIYDYYKKFGHATEIMGASFRNKGEILELAGCDLLTISPELLGELKASDEPVERKLAPDKARQSGIAKMSVDEKTFRWQLNESAMATEKLAGGIRSFRADAIKLEEFVAKNF